MKKRALLYILEIVIFFSSCGSYKKLTCLEPVNVSEFSTEIFNGSYHNKAITTNIRYSSLWYALWSVYSVRYNKVNVSDSAIVNLRFVDNRLYAQLIEEGEIIQEIMLKAKVQDNYLSVKRKYFLIPILPPILCFYTNNKLILENLENENLILTMEYDSFGAVLIMASGNSGVVSNEFVKLLNE
jgi:hypothetical protein